MNNIINDVLKDLMVDGKIFIPPWCNKVKLDVGLSMNAPNSERWLQNEDDLIVFGFEPGNIAYDLLVNKYTERVSLFPQYVHMKSERILKTFFPIKCALSNTEPKKQTFYNTNGDPGVSSLFVPKNVSINNTEEVLVISLNNFFDLFPWEQIPYIDQLKIDAQGSDFDILMGCDKYLDKIVYVTVEDHIWNDYLGKEDDYHRFESFLCDFNFKKIQTINGNSTYLNNLYANTVDKIVFFVENL